MSIYDKASLVLIPSGTKTSKVYSQKPVSGDGDFTFSRSTAATRVNADGNIEKETQNLLLQSNSFDTTWVKSSVSVTSGQSGYDGTSDAWLLSKSGASAFIRQFVSVSGVYTFSVYAKAGSLNWIRLFMAGGVSGTSYFDLQNGVVGTTSGSPIDTKIESVGSGWYRCSVTHNDSSFSNFRIYPADADNDTSGTSGNIYIQDAQLNQGLIAQEVITTTTTAIYGGITDNVPRLDYTDSSCPALLLEPQRTNTDPNGEYLANRPIVVNVSTTTNSIDSPEGVTNATLITNNTTSGQHQLTDNTFSVTSGTDYTISLFLKYRDAQYVRLQFGGTPFGSTNWQNFDVLNGTKGSKGGGISTADSSIEDYGNGWYRCSLTADATATGSNGAFQIRILENDNTSDIPSFAGSGLSTYAWGAQFEQGSYATSYIPTYGSAVTRNAEAALKTGVADLINDGEGSLYMEVTPTNFEGDQRFGISDNIGANRIVLRLYNPSNLQLSCVINSSVEVSIANSGYSAGNTYKIAGAWKDNDAVIYVNGVQVATDTNSNITPSNPLTRISFDNGVGTAKWENPVSQTMYFPTRLSNEELATLTTI